MTAALRKPLKERRKAGRALGYMAAELERLDLLTDPRDLDTAIEALALGAAVHTYPQRYQMARARLMAERRRLLGLCDPVIAQETARTMDVEMGGILIQDAASEPGEAFLVLPLHRYLNDTGAYFVGFGGDGMVKVRLRIHSQGPCEPLSEEFRRLREATPQARLVSKTGRIAVRGGGMRSIEAGLCIGDWLVCAYGLGMGRNPECLVVVAPFSEGVEPLSDTPELML